jgi:beta-lactamase regulating signal transducer with metallopeptidase domain
MIATWMLYTLLVGTLVVAAARCAESLLRLMGRPARWVWAVAIAAAIAVPMVTVLVPAPAVEMSEAAVATASAPTGARESIAVTLATMPAARSLNRPLLLAWGGLTLALLAVLLHGMGVLRGRRREWLRREVDGRELLIASDTGPAVIGWRRMQVVVPTWVLSLDDNARAMILAHEDEHIRARDPQLMLAGLLAAMLIPWHLPLWYAWRRLRMAIELDCDARVLAGGVNRRSYGEILLEAGSRSTGTGLPALATFAERAEQLEERLSALAPAPVRQRGVRMAGAGVTAAVLLTAACTMESPLGLDLTGASESPLVQMRTQLAPKWELASTIALVHRQVNDLFPGAVARGETPTPVVIMLIRNPDGAITNSHMIQGVGTPEELRVPLMQRAPPVEEIEVIEVIRGGLVGLRNVDVIMVTRKTPDGAPRLRRADTESSTATPTSSLPLSELPEGVWRHRLFKNEGPPVSVLLRRPGDAESGSRPAEWAELRRVPARASGPAGQAPR